VSDDHHNPISLHWTDRVAFKCDGQWFVYRLDDPADEAVEPIAVYELCFHLFDSGAA